MLTLMFGTLILALTYGAFWHNQPARRQNKERGDQAFLLGRRVNRALEWLLLMPHFSNPLGRNERVSLTEKDVIPARQTEFFCPVPRTLPEWNPWQQILVDRAAMKPSTPVDLFESTANTDELAAARTT
jgi:hypothetical protein